jgi:hypothetical protein
MSGKTERCSLTLKFNSDPALSFTSGSGLTIDGIAKINRHPDTFEGFYSKFRVNLLLFFPALNFKIQSVQMKTRHKKVTLYLPLSQLNGHSRQIGGFTK